MERYICIHGHFYQPPRENAWLEAVELQHSAYPYHDWNERITAECYAPNTAARILDDKKRITQIVNNYAHMSFNIGPTLLSWMEIKAPAVYDAILQADRESRRLFSGHGSAMAQVYNHMIMPMATRRDKATQVTWGLSDFQYRFKRKPEGMWLPETAVDLETLDVLAEYGIKFTIIAPHQAKRVRRVGSNSWDDVSGGRIDPSTAYVIKLPSGRTISLFFYDGTISGAVAFGGLLNSGEDFARRLLGAFSDKPQAQLVHIATDGESYGHHHRFGEMALAYALDYINRNHLAKVTNYGEYLEKHPPANEVEIFENTSWSCFHGIERWRSDCGDKASGNSEWNQKWRAPLRQGMDWLRDKLEPLYENRVRRFLHDPWAARDDYITVMLKRSEKNIASFLEKHARYELKEQEVTEVLKLLELQRHSLLMFTSCGWFFDDISGIESIQIIQYAGRAVQLAEELFGASIEEQFLSFLREAKSNLPEYGDGRQIYEKYVKPATVDLIKVAAHYAVSALFNEYKEKVKIYCYTVDIKDQQQVTCGNCRLIAGKIKLGSDITRELELISFGALYFGDHSINAGVRRYRGETEYLAMVREISLACSNADFAQVIRLMDKHFGISTYSLQSLFHDDRLKVLDSIMENTLKEVESVYRQVYQSHYPLMLFLAEMDKPLPLALKSAAEFTLNQDLRKALIAANVQKDDVLRLLKEARMWQVALDSAGLEHVYRKMIERKIEDLSAAPQNIDLLKELINMVDIAHSLPFNVNLWQVQNTYYYLMRTVFSEMRAKATGEGLAKERITLFAALGEMLAIGVLYD